MSRPPRELFLSIIPKRLSFRAGVAIIFLIVDKMFGTEGVSYAPLFNLARNVGYGP